MRRSSRRCNMQSLARSSSTWCGSPIPINGTAANTTASAGNAPESMASAFKEISWRGKLVKVPAVEVEDRTVLVLGKWLRIATIHDEVWLEGDGVRNPEAAITKIGGALPADVFTFAQK